MSPVRIHHRFDWTKTSPSDAIIAVIAVIENVDPMQLDFVLFDHIDPAALDALVGNETSVTLSFWLEKYHVRFDGNDLTVRG